MMVLLLSALIASSVIFKARGDVEGYYWRDFDGTIPADAFAGGLDVNNRPIYVGQAYNKFLIPAKIYYNDNTVYYEHGRKELTSKDNVKILCTQHPEQFEWIKTSNDKIREITDVYLVNGGHEPGSTTYIGRTRHDGEVAIGKVLADNLPEHAGLHVTKNGSACRYTTFEVLSFRKRLRDLVDVRASS